MGRGMRRRARCRFLGMAREEAIRSHRGVAAMSTGAPAILRHSESDPCDRMEPPDNLQANARGWISQTGNTSGDESHVGSSPSRELVRGVSYTKTPWPREVSGLCCTKAGDRSSRSRLAYGCGEDS